MQYDFNLFDKTMITVILALFMYIIFLLSGQALRHFDAAMLFPMLVVIPFAIYIIITLIKIFAHKYKAIQVNDGYLTIISGGLKERINVPFDEIKECIVCKGSVIRGTTLGQVIVRTTRGKEYKIVISKPDAFYVPMASHINISLQ